MSHIFFIFILFIFISNITTRREFRRGRSSGELKTFATCFDRLGCIDTNEKWYDSYYRPVNLEPLDRHTIRTEFLFMKAENNSKEILYDILTLKIETIGIAGFRKNTRTFFLIHDFTSNGHTGWIKHMAIAIAEEMDSNVIAVDWEAGAEPPFDQAISNARIVALEMEVFIKMLRENCGITTDKIHLIGHGVGAHIAGYVGKVIKDIDRITDPTGPRFENMPNLVRLDPEDARYVEVLHTEAFNHRSQGTLQPMGHSDFYINNAGHQPGCNETGNSPKITDVTRSELREGKILSACSHKRSFKYYINAITTRECKFVGIACSSYEAFLNGSCSDCENNKCASFDMCPPPKNVYKTKFFLNTHTDAPFCTHAYQVNISIEQNENSKKVDGYFEFILIDTNNKITFTTGSDFGNTKRTYVPGETYTLIVYAPPPAINNMKEAKVRWRSSVAFPFPKKPIYVKYISVRRIPMMGERVPINGLCPESNTEIRDSAYVQFVYCNVAKVQEAQRIAAMTTITGVKTSATTRMGPPGTTTAFTIISNTTWPLPNATTTTHKPPTQCMFPAGATTPAPPAQVEVGIGTTKMPKTEEHIPVTSLSMSGSPQPETSIPTTPEGLTNKVFFDEERNKTYVGLVSPNITTVSVEVEEEEEEEKAHATTISAVTQTESVLKEEQSEGIETEVGNPTTSITEVETETVSPILTAEIAISSTSILKIEETTQEVTIEGSSSPSIAIIEAETARGSSTELPAVTTEEQVVSETTLQHTKVTLSRWRSSTSVEISIATVSEVTEGNFPQLTKENGTNAQKGEFQAKPQFGQGQQSEGYASFTLGGPSTESEESSTVTMLGTQPEVSSGTWMLQTESEEGGTTLIMGTQPEEGASSSILEYESKASSATSLLGVESEAAGATPMLETQLEEGVSSSTLETQSKTSGTSLLETELEEDETTPMSGTQLDEGVSSPIMESQSKASSATSLLETESETAGTTPILGTQPEEVGFTLSEYESKASSTTSLLGTESEAGGTTPILGTQPEEDVSSSVSEYPSKASSTTVLLGTEPEADGTTPILGTQPEEDVSSSVSEYQSKAGSTILLLETEPEAGGAAPTLETQPEEESSSISILVTSIPETQFQEDVTVSILRTQSKESSVTLMPATQSKVVSTILIPQMQSEGSSLETHPEETTSVEASERIALGTSEIETMIAEELTTATTQLEEGQVTTALEEIVLPETITAITEVAEETVATTTTEGHGSAPQLIKENDTIKEAFKSEQAGQGQRNESYQSFTLGHPTAEGAEQTTECTEWYMTEVDTETVEELTHVIAFTGGMGEGISIKAGNVEKPTSEINTYQTTTAAGEISHEIHAESGSTQSVPITEVAEDVTTHFGLSTPEDLSQTGKKNQTGYVTVVVEEIIEEVTESASMTTRLPEEIKEATVASEGRMFTTVSSAEITKASFPSSTFEEQARTGRPTPTIAGIVASETVTTSFPDGGKQAGQEAAVGGESAGNQRIVGQNKGMLVVSTEEGEQTVISTEAGEIARLPTEPEGKTTTTTSKSRKTTTARGTTTISRLTTTRKGKSRKPKTKSTTKSKTTSSHKEHEEHKSSSPTTECTTEELPECDEIEE